MLLIVNMFAYLKSAAPRVNASVCSLVTRLATVQVVVTKCGAVDCPSTTDETVFKKSRYTIQNVAGCHLPKNISYGHITQHGNVNVVAS